MRVFKKTMGSSGAKQDVGCTSPGNSLGNCRGPLGSPDAIQLILFYISAAMLVLTTNTLYGRLGQTANLAKTVLLGCTVIIIFWTWMSRPVPRRGMEVWLGWCVLLGAVYAVLTLANGDYGGRQVLFFFALAALFPLLIYLLRESGAMQAYLRAFVNVLSILALASLVLWLAGPMAGLIQPNCTIESTWNDLQLTTIQPGYYGLCFVTQHSALGSMSVVRNTGIFVEAPMCSFALCCALAIECFLCQGSRKPVVALLVVSVVTTFSSTGWIFLIGLALCRMHVSVWEGRRMKAVRAILLVLLLVIGAYLAFYILGEKLDTSSGGTRVDDFVAGYRAWQNNVLFGNGLSAGDAVTQYMSGFRSTNLGFSNSPMDVLSRGGILLMVVYAFGLVALITCGKREWRLAGILFAFLWTITIVSFLPITALFLSSGVEAVMAGRRGEFATSSEGAGRVTSRHSNGLQPASSLGGR